MAGSYYFVFSGVHIFNTRSRGNDTIYASITLSIDGKDFGTRLRKLGDMNNGDHGFSNGVDAGGLWFGPISLDANARVSLTYSVMNIGHQSDAEAQQAAQKAAEAAAKYAEQKGTGSLFLDIAKAIVQALIGFAFANCDGPVASGGFVLTEAEIAAHILPNDRWDIVNKSYGTDSPAGCGSNSDYNAHLIVLRNVHPPVY